ncbi:MAG: HAD family hydrolase [Bacilli bacterium]|nr:HAD family hydrolase [Bacilli bacterium]
MKKYDVYLFDFDGTLVDSIKSLEDIFILSFRDIGVKVKEEDCLQYTRQPLEMTYKELHAPMDKVDYFVERIRYYLDDKEVLKKTEIYDETIPFLNYLKEHNIEFGIVTSNNKNHVVDVLNLFNIDPDFFTIIVDSDDEPETKPSPKPLQYAFKHIKDADKKKIAYVGDALNDMISANRAGIDAILIDRVGAFKEADNYVKIRSLFDLVK